MINKEQLRKQVIQYFRSIGSGQNIVECIKQALFLHEQFNPVVLFEVISKGKQKITKEDWRTYLVDHSISFSEDELRFFINHNQFQNDATLNQFLEAMIPYNADVVREFKQKYLDALEIRDFDPEVEFIFSELLINEFKFIRTMISIRQDISSTANRKTIENLVKQDLVIQSKARESRKFHQQFHKRDAGELGFHELRKFLQIWVSAKEVVHQFCLLNILRYLKCENPFSKIMYRSGKGKNKRSRNNNEQNQQKRPFSAPRGGGLTNKKIQEQLMNQGGQRSRSKQNKYTDFKHQVMDEFIKDKYNLEDRHTEIRKIEQGAYRVNERANASHDTKKNDDKGVHARIEAPSNRKHHDSYQNSSPHNFAYSQKPHNSAKKVNQKNEITRNVQALKRSRALREIKGGDGVLIVSILEEILIKEERLEKLRKNLAKLNDFNLINLFKLIDCRNNGFVTPRDIADFIQQGCRANQLIDLVNYYGKQQNKLRFHEFCLIFRPLSKQLNEILDSRPQHKIPNPFKKESLKLIFEVLNLCGEMHTNINRRKQDIHSRGLHGSELFRFVDLQDKGYILAECFKQLLQQNNVFCDNKDLKCIMRFFRKKIDEGISIYEFQQFLEI